MNSYKLEQIRESYYSGKLKQLVSQVKAYGVKRFHVHFLEYLQCWVDDYEDGYSREYTKVVHTYNVLTL